MQFRNALALWFLGTGCCGAATRLNCVGDSITAGYGLPAPLVTIQSYPARLQQLIGTSYTVGNYGVSGTTVLKLGDAPYWKTTAYVTSHGSSSSTAPNIVVIMLGSNDAKPQNWVYGSNFTSDYGALIATYATNQFLPNPRILICTPPPVFNNGAFGINPGIVATNISPLIRQLGTNLDLQVIDLQRLLAGHSEWFPDNVHPNAQGAAVMAAIVYAAVSGDTLNGTIPSLAISTLTHTNAVLKWPAGGGGWALQSRPVLGGSSVWLIASNSVPIGNDGISLSFTNTAGAPSAMFRLWNPSPVNN